MDSSGDADRFDDADDEVDLTEEDFDARMAAGAPIMLIGLAARAGLRERVDDYYTLQISDSKIVPSSAGRWGHAPQTLSDEFAPVMSMA